MLTDKQEAFCVAYVETGNASESYRRAGYSARMADKTVAEAASRLLKNSKVIARIAALRAPVAEVAQITLENHLRDLLVIRDAARADMKWSAAVAAEIARGKAAGLYVEKLEHTGADGKPLQMPAPVFNITLSTE